MATVDETRERSAPAVERWYALDPEDVAHRLGVVPESGLSQSEAARRLAADGPNALPVEQPPSPLRRFLAEFTSYMQLILVGAAVVSLLIKQWTHGRRPGRDLALQRPDRAPPGRQGGERDECAAVDDEGNRASAARRHRGR